MACLALLRLVLLSHAVSLKFHTYLVYEWESSSINLQKIALASQEPLKNTMFRRRREDYTPIAAPFSIRLCCTVIPVWLSLSTNGPAHPRMDGIWFENGVILVQTWTTVQRRRVLRSLLPFVQPITPVHSTSPSISRALSFLPFLKLVSRIWRGDHAVPRLSQQTSRRLSVSPPTFSTFGIRTTSAYVEWRCLSSLLQRCTWAGVRNPRALLCWLKLKRRRLLKLAPGKGLA